MRRMAVVVGLAAGGQLERCALSSPTAVWIDQIVP